MLTPYQFASNRPIDGIDLDGLEYLDSDLRLEMDERYKEISLTGDLDVKAKIINLSSKRVDTDAKRQQESLANSVLDMRNTYSARENLLLHPETGERIVEPYRISGSINVDFEFIGEYSRLDAIENGDVVVILVDDINIEDVAAITDRAGYAIIAEIDAFNAENNLIAHELGHAAGDLQDKESPAGDLMTLPLNIDNTNVPTKEYMRLIENLLYRKGMNEGPVGNPDNDTREDAQSLLDNYTDR
jgi:hypothetical protein